MASSAVSPPEQARQALGISISDLASQLGCSIGAVSRYLRGTRTPPPALFSILGGGDMQARHQEWLARTGRAKRARGTTTIQLTTRLPRGVTPEEARQHCAKALAALAAEAGR